MSIIFKKEPISGHLVFYIVIKKNKKEADTDEQLSYKNFTQTSRFPKVYDQFLRNLFYMADSLKDEEEIRMNI